MSRSPFFSARLPDRRGAVRRTGPARLFWGAACSLAVCLSLPVPGGAVEPPDCPQFESICLQAERDGGIDMRTGTARLEGNVVGVLKKFDLAFQAQVLRAFRNERNEWARLELHREVVVEQRGRLAKGDHAVLENDTGRVVIQGHVELTQPFTYVEGDELRLERDPDTSIILGTPERRVFLRREGQVPATPQAAPDAEQAALSAERREPARQGEGTVPAASLEDGGTEMLPDTVLVRADRAEIEHDAGEIRFSGGVKMQRVEMGWELRAEKLQLVFDEERRIIHFEAEGGVRIEQPGRMLSADRIESQNRMDTLLLIGHAQATQRGQFDISSDRVEVYTNVEQGLVQSGEGQRPIRLTLDLSEPAPYALTPAGIGGLRRRGLPQFTLVKLDALRGVTYPNRKAFLAALLPLLSEGEVDLYSAVIAEAAR